jgi:hypothetical protein
MCRLSIQPVIGPLKMRRADDGMWPVQGRFVPKGRLLFDRAMTISLTGRTDEKSLS